MSSSSSSRKSSTRAQAGSSGSVESTGTSRTTGTRGFRSRVSRERRSMNPLALTRTPANRNRRVRAGGASMMRHDCSPQFDGSAALKRDGFSLNRAAACRMGKNPSKDWIRGLDYYSSSIRPYADPPNTGLMYEPWMSDEAEKWVEPPYPRTEEERQRDTEMWARARRFVYRATGGKSDNFMGLRNGWGTAEVLKAYAPGSNFKTRRYVPRQTAYTEPLAPAGYEDRLRREAKAARVAARFVQDRYRFVRERPFMPSGEEAQAVIADGVRVSMASRGKDKATPAWLAMRKRDRQRERQLAADRAWRENTGAGPSRPPRISLSASSSSASSGGGSASARAGKRLAGRRRKPARPAKRRRG